MAEEGPVRPRLFLGLVGGTLGFMIGVGLMLILERVLDGAGGGCAGGNPPLPKAAEAAAPKACPSNNPFCRTRESEWAV